MFKKSLFAAGLVAASVSTAMAAPYGSFEARSVAMGNVSVATGGLQTAAFGNPAMLSINEGKSKFALLIPALGVQAIDEGDIIDLVDDFQATSDPFAQAAIINELLGDDVTVNVNANAALVISGDTFTYAVSYRGTGVANAIVEDTTALGVPDADLVALGYVTQEFGFSIATKLSVAGVDIAVGVRPKHVSVESIEFRESIQTADAGDIADDSFEDLGSFTTLDAGVVISVMDTLRVGLVASNILEETKTTTSTLPKDLDFEKQLRAGVAFHTDFMTIAADLDLIEIDPINLEGESQTLAVGVELNAMDFMQLRAGYQTDVANNSTKPDLFSAGVGFWLGFHLDIAVVAGDDSLGAFVQTGFRF